MGFPSATQFVYTFVVIGVAVIYSGGQYTNLTDCDMKIIAKNIKLVFKTDSEALMCNWSFEPDVPNDKIKSSRSMEPTSDGCVLTFQEIDEEVSGKWILLASTTQVGTESHSFYVKYDQSYLIISTEDSGEQLLNKLCDDLKEISSVDQCDNEVRSSYMMSSCPSHHEKAAIKTGDITLTFRSKAEIYQCLWNFEPKIKDKRIKETRTTRPIDGKCILQFEENLDNVSGLWTGSANEQSRAKDGAHEFMIRSDPSLLLIATKSGCKKLGFNKWNEKDVTTPFPPTENSLGVPEASFSG